MPFIPPFSECSEVNFTRATYFPELVDGLYNKNGSTCGGRDVYEHKTSVHIYMYYLDDYWYIVNETYTCFYAFTGCLFRSRDDAQYPENITSTWEENDGNNFYYQNSDADVDCNGIVLYYIALYHIE